MFEAQRRGALLRSVYSVDQSSSRSREADGIARQGSAELPAQKQSLHPWYGGKR